MDEMQLRRSDIGRSEVSEGGGSREMDEQPRLLIVNIVDDCARCGGGRVAER